MNDSAPHPPPMSSAPLIGTPPAAADRSIPLVAAILSDLMASTRLEPAARQAGCALMVLERRESLDARLAGAAVVILDLTDPVFPFAETYARIRALVPRACVVAFYPHVLDELATAARTAGCEIVMPRSRFYADPAAALRAGVSRSRPLTI